MPQTPGHVRGVINLRGKVTPVVDLRLKFGLPEQEYTQRTCIIVVQAQGEAGPILMGIVVDGVVDVLNLTAPTSKTHRTSAMERPRLICSGWPR